MAMAALCPLLITITISISLLSPASSFSPVDNYLIDCGSSQQTRLTDGRTFKSERDTASLLSTPQDLRLTADSTTSPNPMPLYNSLRLFHDQATYSFHISQPGYHFLRLHFYPFPNRSFNLTRALFSVSTAHLLLLDDFSVPDHSTLVLKEFLLHASDRLSLVFTPRHSRFAFVSAIELISAPDSLLPDSASSLYPPGDFHALSSHAFQVEYRLNVGGPDLGPANDTLYRAWESDAAYNVFVQGCNKVSVPEKAVRFPGNGTEGPLIAPRLVYASAQQMKDSGTMEASFNLTWKMSVDTGYSYLTRLHFCDIVSASLNTLFFKVYINEIEAIPSLDLSSLTGALATAYHRDFVLPSENVTNGTIMVQVGCFGGVSDGILNGLEIMKMSSSAKSLSGGLNRGFSGTGVSAIKIAAVVSLGLAAVVMFLLGTVIVRWRRQPKGWEKQRSFSTWLLPLQGSYSRSSTASHSLFASRRSKSGQSMFLPASSGRYGRLFTLTELRAATNGFDEKVVIGVGGFGKVYLGVLEDGMKVAVKRGNPSSEQGANEFRTEIEMLSKLRHRHLVSLVGFCDEQSEMILVYEYMSNGPFRDHLYGPRAESRPALTWKRRLEICIGAARGLHYLHTGAAQGIIHRDVKTTNILLDDDLVAKVSDFGLSKTAPSLDKTHVSTAVKGSFGYLDPEYFRRQQLTEKSDVYSFGVVLLEALCARQVIEAKLPREEVSLAEWAMCWHRKGAVEKVIDPRVAGTIGEESLRKFVEAAEKCLAEEGAERPAMGDVLWSLECSLQLQEEASSALVIVGKMDSSLSVERSTSSSSLFSEMANNFQGR